MGQNNPVLEMIQRHLGFSESEAEHFMENPRNKEVLPCFAKLVKTRFVFRIIEAKGCGCRHMTGQEIAVRGDGVILNGNGSEGPCIYLVQAMVPVVYGAQEFIYAGLDPNNLKFKQVGCFDVGLSCKGIGHVVVELASETV